MWRVIERYDIATIKQTMWASVVLSRHPYHHDRLCVIKNRCDTLGEHQPMLDTVFDEYQILDDGWRGVVQLSESELVRWSLMVGS